VTVILAGSSPAISSPRTVENIMYKYPKEASTEEKRQITSFEKQQDHYRNKAQDPRNQVFSPGGDPRPIDQEMKTRIVEKFGEAANHLKSLKTALTVLKMEELKYLYSEVKNQETEKKLFIKTVISAGSSPSVMFCKEMIMSNELSYIEAAKVMITLPHYIKYPTPR
jgi:hypothetical protein